MKEFEVTITETLQKSITVEAATREEAQAMVEEMWDKGDVVLDADHFVGAEFSCNDGQEIEADKPIEVLLVEPGQYARMTTIGSSLRICRRSWAATFRRLPSSAIRSRWSATRRARFPACAEPCHPGR